MTRVLLTALLACAFAVAQQSQHSDGQAPHGGAEAVHPGGPVTAESPGQAHAEAAAKHGEGHEEHPMPNEIWWKWANFAILAGGLGWLISKNAGPFFRSRTEAIQAGIAEAAQERAAAEKRAADIDARVSNLQHEIQELRQQSHDEIVREGERVRVEGEAQIRKIQAQAEADIASAAKHASQELKAYSAQLALELAERQLRNRMTPQVQDQLADAFASEVERKAVTH